MIALPEVVAVAMQMGLREPGVVIGAGAYETELAMCPIAAAVRHAEQPGNSDSGWDASWGTRDEFRHRVLDFVDAFDSCAEVAGLDMAVRVLQNTLDRARTKQPSTRAAEAKPTRLL